MRLISRIVFVIFMVFIVVSFTTGYEWGKLAADKEAGRIPSRIEHQDIKITIAREPNDNK